MITNKMLQKAAKEAAMQINDSLPKPEDCKHEFSSSFENKILNLNLEETKQPTRHPILRTAISFLLILTIGFGSILAFSPDARAAVDGWVRSIYNSLYEYVFEGEVSDTNYYQYEAQWIPKNYELISNETVAGNTDMWYQNDKEDTLLFSYTPATKDTGLYIDAYDGAKQTVDINGNKADLYLSDNPSNRSVIVWIDKKTETLFFINGRISKDELIKMASSVRQK